MLTDARLREAQPREKAYKLTDSHGLDLRVTPSGGKLWRWNSVYDSKQKSLSFGPYLLNRFGYHGRHVPHGCRAAFSRTMNEWAKALSVE